MTYKIDPIGFLQLFLYKEKKTGLAGRSEMEWGAWEDTKFHLHSSPWDMSTMSARNGSLEMGRAGAWERVIVHVSERGGVCGGGACGPNYWDESVGRDAWGICSYAAYTSANESSGSGCVTWHGDMEDTRTYTQVWQSLFVRVQKLELGTLLIS